MRLQKYLAERGVASRRASEALIAAGRVQVNGETVTQMGAQVEEGDWVAVDGKVLGAAEKKVYLMAYKPQGMVTTLSDPQGRATVRELTKDIPERVYPVGRLDWDTEGLLVMTNDGDLALGLTHPSKEVEKVYYARVRGILDKEKLRALEAGVTLDDGHHTAPCQIRLEGKDPAFQGQQPLYVTVIEGHNRLVRRLFESVGCPVTFLRREKVGILGLGTMKPGQIRHLTKGEVLYLQSLCEKGED